MTEKGQEDEHTNRLVHETSPYLLQHAHNPVDWYPWGEEAFEKAREENKPVFLSVGYSACHWCHVMEHESFEDEDTARVMNKLFVCIKVDREERPDIDELYMKAVQAQTGGGGWPMSVWLLPDGRPFYGGTYFPPDERFGRPGFVAVCRYMARLCKEEPAQVEAAAEGLTGEVRRLVGPPPPAEGFDAEAALRTVGAQMTASFDEVHGGFGEAPKFPHSMDISLLLRLHQRTGEQRYLDVADYTLRKMAAGGMYDQLGGGFHRYSVDAKWLIPHFEKMLYDNALLAEAYLDAWLVTGDDDHRRVVVEILEYVLREMTSPEGGFFSTQDADSEGEEGKFFAWDREEIATVLGKERGARFCDYHGVTAEGNFEHGKSALWRPHSLADFAADHDLDPGELRDELAEGRARLFEAREARVHPGRDEKVLVDWNGLMIGAMSRAGFHLREPRYLAAARAAASFVKARMFPEGRLVRTIKDGKAHLNANLGDYANLIEGLLDLYESDFDPAHLAWAVELAEVSVQRFHDPDAGGFFFTSDDHEVLIARSKEVYDGATPSAPSVHVMNFLRLSELLGEPKWRQLGEETLRVYSLLLEQHPRAVARMMEAVHFLQSGPREIVLCAATREELEPMLDVLRGRLAPARVVLVRTDENGSALESISPLVSGKTAEAGAVAAYVCRDFVCGAPASGPDGLRASLEEGSTGGGD